MTDTIIGIPRDPARSCPNGRFVEKHMIHNLWDVGDDQASAAAGILHGRRRLSFTPQTNLNSVFLTDGRTMEYYQRIRYGEVYCTFRDRAHKYDCTRIIKSDDYVWDCKDKGFIYASHKKSTGHYERTLDME